MNNPIQSAMNRRAQAIGTTTVAVAMGVIYFDLTAGIGTLSPLFWVYLTLTAAVSLLDVQLHTRAGALSPGIIFAMAGYAQLTLPECYSLGLAAGTLPLLRRGSEKAPASVVLFQLAVAILSLKAGHLAYGHAITQVPGQAPTIAVILSCPALVGVSSFLLAAFEGAQLKIGILSIWPHDYAWSILYYVGCASAAALLVAISGLPFAEFLMIALPLLLLAGRAVRDQRLAMDQNRRRSSAFSGLQLSVLQVLALALEAREGRGTIHFDRLARYAHGMGRALGMEGPQLMALETGALLHDVGKLAVPDYLLSKPGSLMPEEFELFKKHPVVGADIIAKAKLPLPVAPMVRAHHENWDGTGYPDGRKGTEIPVGARILRVLDALDAITADRPYKRGLPLHVAVAEIAKDAGRIYDPLVVQILSENYQTWECEVGKRTSESYGEAKDEANSVANVIAEARHEERVLAQLIQLFRSSPDLEGTMIRFERQLGSVIPHETMVIYRLCDNTLKPWRVRGENRHVLETVEIPIGRGVSGLVARTGRGVADGMAVADLQFADKQGAGSLLRSLISTPMSCTGTVAGVISLYSNNEMHFTASHLRLLTALAPSLEAWLEASLRYHQAESRASTDSLTGLANSAALSAHLQNEIARAARANMALSVVMCDLDGFKGVNDKFGHLAGNNLLKAIADGLKAHCREYDFVSRMGGDEFVVVLPGVDRTAAQARCQALEEVVILAGIEVCGEQCVGLSAGIAQFGVDGSSPNELLEAADVRMYQSKQRRKALQRFRAEATAGLSVSLSV